MMTNKTRDNVTAAAIARATNLCDAALADLAKGRKTFVKGKTVFVPFSDDAREMRKRLVLDAFVTGSAMGFDHFVEPHVADESEMDDAIELYKSVGAEEVERRFAEAS